MRQSPTRRRRRGPEPRIGRAGAAWPGAGAAGRSAACSGCVGCGAPPGRSKVHHLTWWAHSGTTDLSNGVLLCDSCHHRIHDQGWDVQIDGPGINARVWLIPPPTIDPTRTPRPAAQRRFTYQPAA